MAEVFETKATLCFLGDDLDPDEISRILGAQPTRSEKKGGIWFTPARGRRIARTGSWRLATAVESPGNLDKQVAALFSGLSDDLEAFRTLATRFRGEIFAGVFLQRWNEGIGLSPETMSAIGARGLELGLDIYSGKSDDEDA